MVTGFTSSSKSGYPTCYIAASQSTNGALACAGVGTYGDTLGYSFTGASGTGGNAAPNWYNQPDLVVAAYAGRFYYGNSNLESSAWNVGCSPSIWVSSKSYNYTYYNGYWGVYYLNFDWITIAPSVSPGTSISCSASLGILTTGGSSSTYYPPGSFSIESFGA